MKLRLFNKFNSLYDKVEIMDVVPARTRKFSHTWSVSGTLTWKNGLVGYESKLERYFVLLATVDPQVIVIKHQPFTIRFRIDGSGRIRRYTPDYFFVRDTSMPWIWAEQSNPPSSKTLIEVKDIASTHSWEDSRTHMQATVGRTWAKQNDASFAIFGNLIWHEQAIRNSLTIRENARYHGGSYEQLVEPFEFPIRVADFCTELAKIYGISDGIGVICSAILDHFLWARLDKAITEDTLLNRVA